MQWFVNMQKQKYRIENTDYILTMLNQSNLDTVRRWRNKKHVRIWFVHSEVISPEQHQSWYSRYVRDGSDLMFVAFSKRLRLNVGCAALYNINTVNKSCEFGRFIVGEDDVHGMGVGGAIIEMIINFAFVELNLEKVNLDVYDDNCVAIHLYKKTGFVTCAKYVNDGRGMLKMTIGRRKWMTLLNEGIFDNV